MQCGHAHRCSGVTAFLQSKHFNFRTFWNWLDSDAGPTSTYIGEPRYRTQAKGNVVDNELSYVTDLKHGIFTHDIHLGIGYRLKTIHWNYMDQLYRTENHYSAFGQDSIRIGDKFILVGSIRGDYVPT